MKIQKRLSGSTLTLLWVQGHSSFFGQILRAVVVQFGFAAKQLRQNSALIFAVACCFKGGWVQFGCRVFVPDGAQLAASFASGCPCAIFKTSQNLFFPAWRRFWAAMYNHTLNWTSLIMTMIIKAALFCANLVETFASQWSALLVATAAWWLLSVSQALVLALLHQYLDWVMHASHIC